MNESPVQVPSRFVDERPEESGSELDDGSNAQRLEEEERNKGSRSSRLSVKSGRIPEVSKGSGDLDFSLKEHFFSPLNPNNK